MTGRYVWKKGGQIDAIYSDFEKAFDKVPHKRLISKLHSYMIDEGVIKWIVNFLKARKYRVRVNGSYSGWHNVTSGIPQSSVLGPILFLIYINDLVDSCGSYCNMYIFADDAKFYRHIEHPDDQKFLQLAISAFHQWSEKWLLSLNSNKCHVVSYCRTIDTSTVYTIMDKINRQFRYIRDFIKLKILVYILMQN